MMFVKINQILLIVIIVCLSFHQANGQITTWTANGSSNDFFDPANWSNGVPQPENDPQFLLSHTYAIKLTSAAEANILTSNNGPVSLVGGAELNVNHVRVTGGTLIVDEPQTRLRSDGSVLVGQGAGSANLKIIGGAEVDALNNVVTYRDSSIEISTGTLVADNIRLGTFADDLATLELKNDGSLIANNLILGDEPDTHGYCVVDSAIANIDGDLQIGNGGSGELILAPGGGIVVSGTTSVNADSSLEMIGFSILNSSVSCDGKLTAFGNARLDGDLTLSNSADAELGSFEVTGDYCNNGVGSTIVEPGGVVEIGGNYEGAAPFHGNGTICFSGQIRLGDDTHATELVHFSENDIELKAGSFCSFDIRSAVDGEHDRISTEGQVDIDPQAAAQFVFPVGVEKLNVGDTITLIDRAPGSTGEFAGLPEGWMPFITEKTLVLSYVGGNDNADVVLTVTGPLPGDVNLDGFVNLLDIAPFVDRISTGTFQAEADINQDGVVDLLDVKGFVQLLTN